MAKKTTTRPREYDPAVAEQILQHMAETGSLLATCRKPGMPCARTVYNWLVADQEFNAQYARAKLIGIQRFVDETIAIADAPMKDAVAVAQAKLRVDSRHWAAERMAPRQFGAKAGLELSGGLEVKTMDATVRRARIASILERAQGRMDATLIANAQLVLENGTTGSDATDLA